jgi:hypothetical protein
MKKYLVMLPMLFIFGCGESFQKNPVDDMIKEMTSVPVFSIILYDMEERGTFFKDYFHQYRIIRTEKGEPKEEITPWIEVKEDFFNQNLNNMGMEIAAKSEDGEIVKNAAPPGYSSYVGNSNYGHWVDRGGTSFWEFYGQYAFLSTMFNLATFPVRRSFYSDYRGDYYGRRPYYGPISGGRPTFGTNSTYTNTVRPNSTWRRSASPNSFKDRVRNSVAPSSRSGSRYGSSSSSGSSMRSRGGGFGK